MLQINKAFPQRSAEPYVSQSSLTDIFNLLSGLIRRNRTIFIVATTICCILGTAYLFTAQPSFTATANMVIDVKKDRLFEQQGGDGDSTEDAGTVETQVELIKSRNVSLAVIRDLHLDKDPEFVSPKPGVIGRMLGFLTHPFATRDKASGDELQERALGVFAGNEAVDRLGQTYVMEVSFKSHQPEKAAKIANAIVDAYINDQLDSKYQATRRASVWLQDRIKELRGQSIAADQAVVNFKTKNNIVDSGGKLINEQQLAEVNTQLVLAQAATAQAKAKLDRINEVLKQPIPDASVADALANPVIISLRTKYLELAGREAIWEMKYGINHQATVSLRTQMVELRRNISDEMHKIAQGYDSDYQIALARENSLKHSLSQSVNQSQTTDLAQVQMKNLESTSASYKSMYNVLLQRYMETVQKQSFPITEARLISPASPPGAPSHPKKSVVAAGTLAAALLLGFGLSFAREYFDQTFKTGQQLSGRFSLHHLATLPRVRQEALYSSTFRAGNPQTRELAATDPMLRFALETPFAQYSEALRAVKVAVDLGLPGQKGRVLGVTSSLPGEGKSTVAANLAQMIAHAGARVLLVDGDLRNPSLTSALTRGQADGLVEASKNFELASKLIWSDPHSGLFFLPASGSAKLTHTNEILGSDRVAGLFGRLQELFDYIIVDCAPLTPVVDTRTTVNYVDAYLFVVAWGRTKIEVIDHTLREAPEVFDRILGVVLNEANMSVLGRYEMHRSDAYHRKYYSKYVRAA